MQNLPEFDELKEEELNAALFGRLASHLYRYENRVKLQALVIILYTCA